MARPLRIDVRDGVYHVTSRGLERRAIVREDRDRMRWLDLLAEVATGCDWRVLAWAVVDNHFQGSTAATPASGRCSTGVPAECLGQRGRWGNDARAVAVYLSRRLTPTPLAHTGG